MLLVVTSGDLPFALSDLTVHTRAGAVVTAVPAPGKASLPVKEAIHAGQILEGDAAFYVPRGKFVLSLVIPGGPTGITWKLTG